MSQVLGLDLLVLELLSNLGIVIFKSPFFVFEDADLLLEVKYLYLCVVFPVLAL